MNLSSLWTRGAEQYLAEAARWREEAELVLAIELDGDLNSTARGAEHFRKYYHHVLELSEFALQLAAQCYSGATSAEKIAQAHREYLKLRGLVALSAARMNLARAIRSLNTRDYSLSTQHLTLDRLAHFITSQGPPRELASITETLSS
jgi:hypothetical protein